MTEEANIPQEAIEAALKTSSRYPYTAESAHYRKRIKEVIEAARPYTDAQAVQAFIAELDAIVRERHPDEMKTFLGLLTCVAFDGGMESDGETLRVCCVRLEKAMAGATGGTDEEG
jgi:hypothetical protein